MKERPILFSAPMVRALLDGSKTQTRRVCKPAQAASLSHVVRGCMGFFGDEEGDVSFKSPYGEPGDRLWVKETHLAWWSLDPENPTGKRKFSHVAAFRADGYELQGDEKWIPSIHMRRAASRITLEITDVRVERLQDISHDDALAEGVYDGKACRCDQPLDFVRSCGNCGGRLVDAVDRYWLLWETINGAGSWDLNPWVWVVVFKKITPHGGSK